MQKCSFLIEREQLERHSPADNRAISCPRGEEGWGLTNDGTKSPAGAQSGYVGAGPASARAIDAGAGAPADPTSGEVAYSSGLADDEGSGQLVRQMLNNPDRGVP